MGRSLQSAFAAIPDRRGTHGRRHSLPAILSLAVSAMLSGTRSLYAIHQWGRRHDTDTARLRGSHDKSYPPQNARRIRLAPGIQCPGCGRF